MCRTRPFYFIVILMVILVISSWACGSPGTSSPTTKQNPITATSNITKPNIQTNAKPTTPSGSPSQQMKVNPSPNSTAKPSSPVASVAPEHGEWIENWSVTEPGTYKIAVRSAIESLRNGGDGGTYIKGDLGSWLIYDTNTVGLTSAGAVDKAKELTSIPPEVPDFSYPTIECIQTADKKYLSLTVTDTSELANNTWGGGVDDLWVDLVRPLAPYPKLNKDTVLSFDASGQLAKDDGFIGLVLGTYPNYLCYTLAVNSSDKYKTSLGFGYVIPLDDTGTYTRNVFNDFTQIAHYGNPANDYLKVLLIMKQAGHAEFGKISIKW